MPSTDEAGFAELALDPFGGEFRADLGQEILPFVEVHDEAGAGQRHLGGLLGAQPHLDPLLVLVPQGDVAEPVRIEVAPELLVEHAEHVAVEVGGDAGSVVIGGDEPLSVLDQIGADEQ